MNARRSHSMAAVLRRLSGALVLRRTSAGLMRPCSMGEGIRPIGVALRQSRVCISSACRGCTRGAPAASRALRAMRIMSCRRFLRNSANGPQLVRRWRLETPKRPVTQTTLLTKRPLPVIEGNGRSSLTAFCAIQSVARAQSARRETGDGLYRRQTLNFPTPDRSCCCAPFPRDRRGAARRSRPY